MDSLKKSSTDIAFMKEMREMSNFVEFTGLWYSTTLDES